MGRMMPGRIRQEGIDLYEAGKLTVLHSENGKMELDIAGERFIYSDDDSDLLCSCDLFQRKGYCQHLAATEYYLKNDGAGKDLKQSLKEEGEQHKETVRRTYFGGLFLDEILGSKPEELGIKYRLSVEGNLLPYDRQIDWTLKISRLPDTRAYIVRDIGAFLRLLKTNGHYQIGKNYYEQLAYENFDEPSQAVLDFLWNLVPEKASLDSDILIHFGRHFRLPQAYFEEGLELLNRLDGFVFTYQKQAYPSLMVLPLTEEQGLYHFEVTVHTLMIEMVIHEKRVRPLFQGRYLLVDGVIYSVDRKQEHLIAQISNLVPTESGLRKVQVDFQDQNRLALSLLDLQTIGTVKAPKRFKIHDFTPHFHMEMEASGSLILHLVLDFDGRLVRSEDELDLLPFASHFQHLEAVYQAIGLAGFRGKYLAHRPALSQQELYPFFRQQLPLLESMGQVHLSENLQSLVIEAKPQLEIVRNGSLLDISFDLTGIAQSEIDQALEALLNQEDHYTSPSGKVLVFDEETKKISQTLLQLRAKHGKGGQVQVHALAGYQLALSLSGFDQVRFSKDFQEMAAYLAQPDSFPMPDVDVKTALRDYQQTGVKWLSMLDYYGFGGILADDMGLGKTLQTIAFLSSRMTKDSKVLILAPSSLIYNWLDECKRFAPNLDVAVVHGNKEQREEIIANGHQVLVTSYPSFRQDVALYRQEHFDYLILDEAQVMKNAQSKIAQLLREFEVGNCFALSGTPIENHLTELWSIFQIVLPGLLPGKQDFGKLAAKDIARTIQPFVLRRHKEDVLQELPDLIEVNVLNELTDEQKAIYLAQLQQMRTQIAGADDAQINRSKIEILSGITRLRQICDTPSLFMEEFSGESGKLNSLKELLLQLKEGEHRVLIFSQFRNMLEKIEEQLIEIGMTSYTLTGSTPANQRQEMTQAFNAGSRDAFLISLKAGGVGLNLTGADTVILVDLWWNPAVEAQAISRAHRMGQTEKVECYRLITRGTIEEKIQELQENKKNLVKTVLDGNESRANLTVEDIREILGIE
ncbi:TPA: SNF2 helicase associated domain-containing protein [Streptococcus suis]|nr:SNF2 helicase associated domain-containing protein [Streptococcus suis]HEM6435275.1 SNF2 helicase associated domain-containing protein [Streptococcus suis]